VSDFTARVDRQGNDLTVVLEGELDLAAAPTLERELDGIVGRVTFDCTKLSFIDSSGLAVFARVDRNGGASLRHVNNQVRRVLEVVGLEYLVTET
jgi:anti-anti-sigma factor